MDESGDSNPTLRVRPSPVSLIRALIYFVPSYAVAIVGYLAVNVIAARMLGPSGFGYLVVLLTVAGLVAQLALLGLHRAGLREASRAEDTDTLIALRRQVRSVLLVPLPIASVATAAVVWLIGPGDDLQLATAVLSGVLVYQSGYQLLSANFLRGLGHIRTASLLSGRSGGALVAAVQAAGVGLIAYVAPDSGLAGVLLGIVAGYLGPLCYVQWVLNRSWPVATGPHHTLRQLRTIIKRDWRFTFSQSGGYLNSTVELWLAGAVLTAGGTSLFAASQRLGRLLVIPATSLATVFSPAIARLSSKGERTQLQTLIRTAASVTTAFSAVLWLPMVIAPEFVLRAVFGAGFEDAAPALMLIATGYLLSALSGMSGKTLSMSHYEGDLAIITWIVVALRIVSGLICAYLWGVTGLAASAVAISAAYYVANWVAVRRRLSISTHATLRPNLRILARIAG
ncbi:lipopolysaccharide biosynthesis protein [Nocardioides sp.]|uniref:lipopolysaccharide biosynthesis protein n=1 Tax=Nocardioides sp. TaxID=35761 RepID=UPI002ED4EC7C